MDSKIKMGSTSGMVAENKLTCALEFPILKIRAFIAEPYELKAQHD
jgi:hypothetical protein